MIELYLDVLPPSSNKLYATVRGRRRILTAAGRDFKNLARICILKQLTGAECVNGQHWHMLSLCFFFPALETKGKNAASRFLRIDAGNREKIVTDLLAEVFNFNDTCVKKLVLEKDVGTPGVRIQLLDLEEPET